MSAAALPWTLRDARYIAGETWSSDFPTSSGAYITTHDLSQHYDAFVTKISASGDGLVYSTFLGGSSNEWGGHGAAIAVDEDGCAYIAGGTISSDFPTTPGAYDTTYNDSGDCFITKLNASGSDLVYSTLLGDTRWEECTAIAVDSAECAYVTGITGSESFPTTSGAYDRTQNGQHDVFVVKLNAEADALIYSTLIGSSDYEDGNAIAIDDEGRAYITGVTESPDFPTTAGVFDGTYNGGGRDGYILRLSADGADLLYSGFLGGGNMDWGRAVVVGGGGCAYVTGTTESPNFPTTSGAYDTVHNGLQDAFATKISSAGDSLVYSTFLGGSKNDYPMGIALDPFGCACVTGATGWSQSYPSEFPVTAGAYDTTHNLGFQIGDAFVTRFSSSGSDLAYSTFLGGSDDDWGTGITLGDDGSAYVVGQTTSSDFPTTPGVFDSTANGNEDAFVTKLSLMTTYYVSDSAGDDSYDGLAPTWDGTHGPKKTIQAGIDVSFDGDTVIVADGTYTGAGNRDIQFLGKAITVRSENGAEDCIIDCGGSSTYEHRGFYFGSNEGRDSVVEGLKIVNGYCGIDLDLGGGIYCESSSPTIRDCIITRCMGHYGGGIASRYGIPLIDRCLLVGNTSWEAGGIRCEKAVIRESIIVGNMTDHIGAGLYLYGNAEVENCIIGGNESESSSDDSGGGGIWTDASPRITACTISGNRSGMWGGGIRAFSSWSHSTVPVVTDCMIVGNAAVDAGGIWGKSDSLQLTNCTVSCNAADLSHGSLIWSGQLSGVNSVFWGNGAEELSINEPDTIIELYNCDIQGGWSGQGGDNIDADPGFAAGPSGTWTAGGSYDSDKYQVTFTDAGASWEVNELAGMLLNPDTSQPLQFYIAGNTEDTITVWVDWQTVDDGTSWVTSGASYQVYDYHLAVGSPCIDTGTNDAADLPSYDLDGNLRVWFGGTSWTVDMGVYEYASVPLDVTSMTLTTEGHVQLTWNSSVLPGASYTVEYSDEEYSDSMTWNVLVTGVASAGNQTSYTDTTAPAGTSRYYRILDESE